MGRGLGGTSGENLGKPEFKAELQSQELTAAPWPQPPLEGTQSVKVNRCLQQACSLWHLLSPSRPVSPLIHTSACSLTGLMELGGRSFALFFIYRRINGACKAVGSRPPLGENVVTSGTGSRRYRETPTCGKHDRISELKSTSLEPPCMSGTTEAQGGDMLALREKQGHRVGPRKARDGFLCLGEEADWKFWGAGPLDRVGGCNERMLWEPCPHVHPVVPAADLCSVTCPQCTAHTKPPHRGQ